MFQKWYWNRDFLDVILSHYFLYWAISNMIIMIWSFFIIIFFFLSSDLLVFFSNWLKKDPSACSELGLLPFPPSSVKFLYFSKGWADPNCLFILVTWGKISITGYSPFHIYLGSVYFTGMQQLLNSDNHR